MGLEALGNLNFNNSRYLGKGSGVQAGGSWGTLGNSEGLGTLRGLWGSVELNHQSSRGPCDPGEFWGELEEGLGEGRFTLSILVALGRFLGFLVRETLTKLWKAADLGRKKPSSGVREPETFPSDHQPWLCPPSHHLLLPFAFFL